jgi:hypothetical protein
LLNVARAASAASLTKWLLVFANVAAVAGLAGYVVWKRAIVPLRRQRRRGTAQAGG